MCGGIGSRFWPYSRTNLPKQFLDFLGTGRSLLQMSYDRICTVVPKENILLITNEQYANKIREQLPDVADEQILLEPARRNTAPCIAWAAWHIMAKDPQASMVVTPSDHLIMREQEFHNCILRGFEFVENNDSLLTLGVDPTRPETGYGYIQVDTADGNLPAIGTISKVKVFTEKPNLELAKVFLETGEFFWNSGIFMWRASVIKQAFQELAPDMAAIFDAGIGAFGTPDETAFINENFTSCASISIDYAIMEKAQNVYVETVSIGWSDLGTWGSLYEVSPKNREGNVTQNCNILAYNASGNVFAVRGEKLIVVDGLNDYIISDAGDVLLICPKSEEQHIRQMVNDAKVKFGDKYI
jgi:mannose-1-phosphate guanylyltransferase